MSERWRAMLDQLADHGVQPVLLVGERGTGKTTLARAVATDGSLTVVDGDDNGAQLQRLVFQLAESSAWADGTVVLRRIDLMPDWARSRLAVLIRNCSESVRFVATAREDGLQLVADDPLLDHFVNVRVPPLREHPEDIPSLVRAFTANHTKRDPDARRVHWMTDALQALSRNSWSGNVITLESVVASVLQSDRTGYVTARELPPELVARTSRRLDRLATAQAQTILRALREVNGNKSEAAERLGIARSALYHKLRAFGIDPIATTV